MLFFFFFFTFIAIITPSPLQAKLSYDYYSKTCPTLPKIIRDIITNKQITNPTTAAATLRLYFHDCMVEGCDGSVLITSNTFNKAERDADLNLNLPGDAFDVVVRAKTALELECPNVVSCADILSLATRDLVTMVGGPFYNVKLGRKDGLVSKAEHVKGNIPESNMSMNEIVAIFRKKGLTIQETVALSGAHTIGFSHCKEFANRVYNFSKGSKVDPTLNPRFAGELQNACTNYTKKTDVSVFNDVMTPNKFDNMYYQNLPRGMVLLASDRDMIVDGGTKYFAELYGKNQTTFFNDFAKAMEKLSVLGTKMGKNGEVRHRCDAFNNIVT